MNKGYIRSVEIATVQEENLTVIMVPSTGKIHELDEVSTFIWNKIPEVCTEISEEQIVANLMEEYDVDYEVALADVKSVLQVLLDERIIITSK